MRITKTKTLVYDFDPKKELDRLYECFKGKQLKRQLDIFSAVFDEKDLKKAEELYDALPYCKKHHCPEQEFVGFWWSIFNGGWGENEYLIHWENKFDF